MASDQQGHERYRNDTQQQLIELVHAMARSWPAPASVAALSQETGFTRDQILRTAANLAIGGWAEQRDTGWMLTPAITQISERLRLSIAQLHHGYLG